MATWAELEREAPDIAAFAADRLRSGPAYMATVDGRGAPRVHPVSPIVGGGRLFVFMEPTSPKGRDLRERGWCALHNGVPDNQGTGGEVSARGRGRLVVEADTGPRPRRRASDIGATSRRRVDPHTKAAL